MIPSQLGRFLVIAGVLVVVVGLLLMSDVKFGHLGKLPGDIVHKGKNVQFYFPIVTCLGLSAVLTLVLWVISLLTKK
jgi:hypothetical protein